MQINSSIKRNLYLLLLLLIFVDFGSDSINRSLPVDFSKFKFFFDYGISLTLILLALISGFKVPILSFRSVNYYAIVLVYLIGLLSGLAQNYSLFALQEFVLLAFFISGYSIISGAKWNCLEFVFEKIVNLFLVILVSKLVIYIMATKYYDGIVSWKILMKQTPLALIGIGYLLNKILTTKCSKLVVCVKIILLQVIITLAASRGMIVSELFVVALILFVTRSKLLFFLPLLAPIIYAFYWIIYTILLDTGSEALFDYLLYGNAAITSVHFRVDQLDELFRRIAEHPWFGVGFGYYNETYSDYYLLNKPYLLEMDLINLFSKIGMIGTIVFLLLLFHMWLNIRSKCFVPGYGFVRPLFISILGLLLFSTSQTFVSSYIFPLLLGCTLAVLNLRLVVSTHDQMRS